MSVLHFLLVEDDEGWVDIVQKAMKPLAEEGHQVDVQTSSQEREAQTHIKRTSFDLIVLDLSLDGALPDQDNEKGLGLIDDILGSSVNRNAPTFILSAILNVDRYDKILSKHKQIKIFRKGNFDNKLFLLDICKALCESRVARAERKARARHYLTLSHRGDTWLGWQLNGPQRTGSADMKQPVSFPASDLARRADRINVLFTTQLDEDHREKYWREEARSIGFSVYDAITKDPVMAPHFFTARELSTRDHPLCIRFRGPSESLATPFELVHDGNDYLGFDTILTRNLLPRGQALTRKPEPFHQFFQNLREHDQTLNILLIGANPLGDLDAVDVEVHRLEAILKSELNLLSLDYHLKVLSGEDARYEKVVEVLDSSWHIIHYAGHGRHNHPVPERGGLVLKQGKGFKVLEAEALKKMVTGTDLRFVFLSCCLGAMTEGQTGPGEFHGVMEALARGDTPAVLGYRWAVADADALSFALNFYGFLWETLSPGMALYQARKRCDRRKPIWASAILLEPTNEG